MKYLKYILLLVISLALFPEVFAQQLTQTYPGTWNYQNGNQVFVVKIWNEGDYFYGHYKMITVDNNGQQTSILYNSRQEYSNGFQYPHTIFGRVSTQSGLLGVIHDNTIDDYDENFKIGDIQIKITQAAFPGCTTCTVLAAWKVKRTPGMMLEGEPPFSVPTNITLTKVSDQVVWDD